MSEKILGVVIGLMLLGYLFCFFFFSLGGLSPNPVHIEITKSYLDVEDRPIRYKLSVLGSIQYSKWYNPWKRDCLEDSLTAASWRIMDEYFEIHYINKISDDTILYDFNSSKYFSSNLEFDSLNFVLSVQKEISLTGKPPS